MSELYLVYHNYFYILAMLTPIIIPVLLLYLLWKVIDA